MAPKYVPEELYNIVAWQCLASKCRSFLKEYYESDKLILCLVARPYISSHSILIATISAVMSRAALEFLYEYGHQSLISLGCGEKLNRLDNHLKILIGCGLNYYVGIDRLPQVSFDIDTAFIDRRSSLELLSSKFDGGVEGFISNVRLFPIRILKN